MATELKHTVKPSGGDFTNIADCIAHLVSAHANFVTADVYGTVEISGSWSSADTAPVTIQGLTLDATRYLGFITDAANRATASGWKDDRYRLELANAYAFTTNDDFVRWDGLQVSVTGTNAANQCPFTFAGIAASNEMQISNCRIRLATGNGYTSYAIITADTDAIVKMWNIIVELGAGNAGTAHGIQFGNGFTLYNGVIYGFNRGAADAGGHAGSVYDSAVFNNTDDFYGTFNAVDYCASDDNDGTNNVAEGTTGGAAWPNIFEDAANGDFRLKTGVALIGAAGKAGSGLFSTDIEGTARGAAWDVGAHEYVASGTAHLKIINE